MTATLVKICGITNVDDALAAAELGAGFVGFVFHAASPRNVATAIAAEIAKRLPASIGKVGVFVDQPVEQVRRIVGEAGLDVVQLHGDETPEVCEAAGARVWKALRVSHATAEHERMLRDAAAYERCECLLIDAKTDTAHGGSGHLSDWQLAAALAQRRRVVLAGGLTAANVGEAVRTVRPWAIDVSSGVESRPGKKDKKKMADLFAALRASP